MLVELKDVEVFIEPNEILTQALEEGDLTVDTVIRECITEGGDEAVLDALDNDDIINYVEKYDLDIKLNVYEQIKRALVELSQKDKAQLLWYLLKCEEN